MTTIKIMKLRYDGVCSCGEKVMAGQSAAWDKSNRVVVCEPCLGNRPAGSGATVASAGVPGASLVREYDKRRARREDRIRTKHPKIGGLLLAITDEPATTRAFDIGASGERKTAERLAKMCGDDVLFLHNRRRGIGRTDGDIDHIAVAPSGVFIIDPKHYRGAKVEVRRSGGLWSERTERLFVRGRDCTNLLESLTKQEAAVRAALTTLPEIADVPVTALFCFVNANLPMLGTLEIRGFKIMGSRATGRLVSKTGPLTSEARQMIWEHLAQRLPSA